MRETRQFPRCTDQRSGTSAVWERGFPASGRLTASTSGRHAQTKSGEEENTAAGQRALEGKLRTTSLSTWDEVDGFGGWPRHTHTHVLCKHKETHTHTHTHTHTPQYKQRGSRIHRRTQNRVVTQTQDNPFTRWQLRVSVCLHVELRHSDIPQCVRPFLSVSLPPTSLCCL